MTDTERSARALAGLLRQGDSEVSDSIAPVAGRDLVRAAVVLRRRGRGRRRAMWAGAALAAVAVFTGGWATGDWYGLGGAAGGALAGATLVAPGDSEARLELGDGTQVDLQATSRLHVDEQAREVRGTLAAGAVAVSANREGARPWALQAGPYLVRVEELGGFVARWDESTRVLGLDLVEGEAAVEGPLDGGRVELRPGQRLRVEAQSGRFSLTPLIDRELLVASAAPVQSGTAPAGTASSAVPTPTTGSGGGAAEKPWSALVSQGEFEAVLQAAEQRGIGACLSSCSSSDLHALSLAARYTGRASVALKTWRALRSRFAGSKGAANAAFFLGRQAANAGQHAQALRWFDTYLGEAPGGRYAADALGAKMLATEASSGRGAARSIARAYLERFPKGVHAKSAKRILGR